MALPSGSVNCPSCGAPVALRNRFVKLAVCEFCQQTMHLTPEGADPTGKSAVLSSFGSLLSLNAHVRVGERAFDVVGRLRFEYEDGYWDEWYVVFTDGQDGWLVEDEGELSLVQREALHGAAPDFDGVRVGAPIELNGQRVVVTERGEAAIQGGEGQLPLAVRPGERVRYLDGNASGRQAMLEYTAAGVELCLGEPLDADELEIEEVYA